MNKTNKILIAIFGAQLALGLVTWTMCQSKPSDAGAADFLTIASSDVTAIEIIAKAADDTKAPDKVTLDRKDGKWVISTADDFQADSEKVEKVLGQISGLKIRNPVATQTANHNALNVGAKEFDRKVTVQTGAGAQTFVVGSAQGSSVHLRREGEDNVYRAKGLSVWALNATERHYLNTEYVKIDKDKIGSVSVVNTKGTLNFTKQGEEWSLAELPAGAKLDQNKVKSFVGQIAKLDLTKPVGKTVKAEYGLAGGTKVIVTSTEDETPVTTEYTIGGAADDQYFYAKAEGKGHVVTVSKWSTEQARTKTTADFLEVPKES